MAKKVRPKRYITKGKVRLIRNILLIVILLALYVYQNFPSGNGPDFTPTEFGVIDSSEEYASPDGGTLSVCFIDVGQGSATLLCQTDEDGKEATMLVDTGVGGEYPAIQAALAEYNVKTLDYLLVTHVKARNKKVT